ncbi:rRNA maturation RNase YbeY [Patescibacteria group bacterium]|nr:MAG: rRNA maturation RNase YbeY [Patescibacteria group bacterium]
MIRLVINRETQCRLSDGFISKTAAAAAKLEKKLRGEAEVNIIGDAAMKKLNYRWRGRNVVTDVLAFAWQEEKKIKGETFGQIYLSPARIKRQAKECGVLEKEEFARVLVHGLLHLAGYDHIAKKEAKIMFGLQERIVCLSVSQKASRPRAAD